MNRTDAVGFYFVRWTIPGKPLPQGSQTFATARAAAAYARRGAYAHPTWTAEIVHHVGGEQTVVGTVMTMGLAHWNRGGDFCSCGQDTVVCQGCGRIVCGSAAVWVDAKTDPLRRTHPHGNIGPCCFARFGIERKERS